MRKKARARSVIRASSFRRTARPAKYAGARRTPQALRPERTREIDLRGELGHVDERVPVALGGGDRSVPMTLVDRRRLGLVPREQDREALGDELPQILGRSLERVAPDRSGVPEEEVEHGPGDRPLPARRLELRLLAAAAVGAHDLLGLHEVEVGRVAAEAVAAGLEREEVVEVAAHRLLLAEPRLGHDVLAVEREERLEDVQLVLDPRLRRRRLGEEELLHAQRPLLVDLEV